MAISDIFKIWRNSMAKQTIKLDIGTIYKKTSNSSYYFRYQINGQRKAVSLKTKNQKEAIAKAQELIPVLKATTTEVISVHVKHAKGLAIRKKSLNLTDAWEVYSKHPERATPATVSEQNAYKSTFDEFVTFVGNNQSAIDDITPEITNNFSDYLKGSKISVETHNRKMRRLKRIFEVLKEYREGENPFLAQSLRRKMREEQAHMIRRQAFTKEQEQDLLKVLENDAYKVKNKPEIRVVYHLGMFTGQRLKDCALLRWDKVDLNRKRIWVKQFKTGQEVTIPIAPQLLNVLKKAQSWKCNQYVCPNVAERYNLLDKNGKNTGANLVDIDVLRVIKWIGLEPSVKVLGRNKKVTVYSFHSLRHSFASHCAEAGVPKAVVLSILGADSNIVDKYYTHIGDEAQEKAIMAISGTYTSVSPQERIDKALVLVDACKKKPKLVLEIEKILR